MKQNKKLTDYVSEIDNFLQAFDKGHELTAAQRKEKEKFRRIYYLRDVAAKPQDVKKKKLWEDF
jgi:uncharacterized protein YnzC (UPF0291/DUF896 family)